MNKEINKNKDKNEPIKTDKQFYSSIIKNSEEVKLSISLPEILLEAIDVEASRKK